MAPKLGLGLYVPMSQSMCAGLDSDTAPSDWAQQCYDNNWPMTGSGSITGCTIDANAIQAPLDAKVADVAKSWNPPATFTGGQIRSAVSSVYSMLDSAQALVNFAIAQNPPSDQSSDLKNETDEITRHRAQADLYVQSAQSADSSGQPVAAPNFKQWIINAMNEASNASVAAYVVGCTQPWWANAYQALAGAMDALVGVVKGIVGVVVKVGTAVVNAVEGAATAIAFTARVLLFVTSYWPLLLIATLAGGYAYYRKKAYGRVFPEGFARAHAPKFLFPAIPRHA